MSRWPSWGTLGKGTNVYVQRRSHTVIGGIAIHRRPTTAGAVQSLGLRPDMDDPHQVSDVRYYCRLACGWTRRCVLAFSKLQQRHIVVFQ